MVEDLEERYDLEGMTIDEIHNLLGEGDVESVKEDGTYSIGYYMRDAIMYYIDFDENGVVVSAKEVA